MPEANELFQLKRLIFFKRAAGALFVLSLPFYIYNFLYDQTLFGFMTLFLMGLVMLYLRHSRMPGKVCYRSLCALLSGMILLLLYHQADRGMELNYVFTLILPLMYYKLLGKNEGLIWSLLYLIPVSAVNVGTHLSYIGDGVPLRTVALAMIFLLSYLAVTVISYQIEAAFKAVYEELISINSQLREKHEQLLQAQREIRTLQSFMSMCMHCKRVKDEQSGYVDVSTYIHTHTDTDVSHCLCPDCLRELYPDIAESVLRNSESERSSGQSH